MMMLYKDTKAMVHSPDGNIVSGNLQGDKLTPFLFIICQDYVLWMSIDLMKENGFTLKKAKSRQRPTETITNVDHTDN